MMQCANGKASHYTEESARAAARHRAEVVGFELNVYRCQICRGWHLTRFPRHLVQAMASRPARPAVRAAA